MSWEETEKLKRKFAIHTINDLFLDKKIDYDFNTKDYEAYVINKYSCLGGFDGLEKRLHLDLDGTLNAYQTTFSDNFWSVLREFNTKIKRVYDLRIHPLLSLFSKHIRRLGQYIFPSNKTIQLRSEVRRIPEKSSMSNVLQKISKEVKDSRLKEDEYWKAGRIAVKRTPVVTNLYLGIKELEELGFKNIHLDTYASEAVAHNFGREVGIPSPRIKPLKWVFHRGKFENFAPFSEMYKKIDEEEKDAIFVTDDWEADRSIAGAIEGLLVWVPEKEKSKPKELADKVFIQLPEMRKDFTKLSEVIKKYELGRLYTFYLNPESLKQLILLGKDIKKNAELCKSSDKKSEILIYGQMVKQKVETFCSLSRPVFPEKSYEIRELLNELDHLEDVEKYKNVIEDINSRIDKTPFPKAKEEFVQSLEPYVKEWSELKQKEVDWLYG